MISKHNTLLIAFLYIVFQRQIIACLLLFCKKKIIAKNIWISTPPPFTGYAVFIANIHRPLFCKLFHSAPGDQVYMAVFFCYLVKSDLSSHQCSRCTVAYTGKVTIFEVPEEYNHVYLAVLYLYLFSEACQHAYYFFFSAENNGPLHCS